MKTVHKVEIYDRNFNLKDFSGFNYGEDDVNIDYLTVTKNVLSVGKLINAENGDFLYSTSGIQGVIDSVEYSNGQTLISYKPLLSLFDVSVYFRRERLSASLIGFFETMITDTFVTNEDVSQNIPGLTVISTASVLDIKNATLNIVDDINNILTLLQKALKKYRLCVVMRLLPYEKKLEAELFINQNTREIIANKPYVIDSEIYIKPSNGGVNKIIAYWKEHEEDSISPLIVKKDVAQDVSRPITKYYDGEDAESFAEKVMEDSYDMFSYDESSNYISVTIDSGSNLYGGYEIGDLSIILFEKTRYTAVLTQIITGDGVTQYVFGTIRLNLTDKLLLGGF